MKGIRTYRTTVAIVFTLAFLAFTNLYAFGNISLMQGKSKTWEKDLHELFHPVMLTKHLKVKSNGYPLVKKFEHDKLSLSSVYTSFNRLLQSGQPSCYKFCTGVSLHKYNCVLLI